MLYGHLSGETEGIYIANRNFSNGGKLWSMHTSPVQIDCNFTVTPTNTKGITSLKGPTVSQVYMNSSAATPSKAIAAGTILVQLADNYNRILGYTYSIQSPNSGSDVKIDNSAMTAGVAYVITTLGDATTAKWRAIGVPLGVTPAVGVSFIALTNGGTGNTLTSKVQTAATAGSTVASIEMVGNPNLTTLYPLASSGQGYGAQFIFQCRDFAGALVAPVTTSNVQITLYLSNSSITVQGE